MFVKHTANIFECPLKTKANFKSLVISVGVGVMVQKEFGGGDIKRHLIFERKILLFSRPSFG